MEQHYSRLAEIIESLPEKRRPEIAKFSGASAKPGRQRNEILQGLADGSTALVVGTKALISDSVKFNKLGLAIIDEQHKYAALAIVALLPTSLWCLWHPRHCSFSLLLHRSLP